jgi:hypothetical protein
VTGNHLVGAAILGLIGATALFDARLCQFVRMLNSTRPPKARGSLALDEACLPPTAQPLISRATLCRRELIASCSISIVGISPTARLSSCGLELPRQRQPPADRAVGRRIGNGARLGDEDWTKDP